MGDSPVDYAQVWRGTLQALDSSLSAQERAFARLCRLVGVLDGTALVKVPNGFTKDFLETRARDQIHAALAAQLGHPVQLAVSVDESLETDAQRQPDEPTGSAQLRDLGASAPALGGADEDDGRPFDANPLGATGANGSLGATGSVGSTPAHGSSADNGFTGLNGTGSSNGTHDANERLRRLRRLERARLLALRR